MCHCSLNIKYIGSMIMEFKTNLTEDETRKILNKVKSQRYKNKNFILQKAERHYILSVEDRIKLKWKCVVKEGKVIISSKTSIESLYRGIIFGFGILVWLTATFGGILIINREGEFFYIILELVSLFCLIVYIRLFWKSSHKYYESEVKLFFEERVFNN